MRAMSRGRVHCHGRARFLFILQVRPLQWTWIIHMQSMLRRHVYVFYGFSILSQVPRRLLRPESWVDYMFSVLGGEVFYDGQQQLYDLSCRNALQECVERLRRLYPRNIQRS